MPKENNNIEVNQKNIESIEKNAILSFQSANSLEELTAAKIAHIGDKSPFLNISRRIGELPSEDRKIIGKIMGASRKKIKKILDSKTDSLNAKLEQEKINKESIDVTSPLFYRHNIGARHPLSILQEKVEDIFVAMGWEILDGPEIESEWFNFDALNFDPDHPARAMQDTFFMESYKTVLRTHTSPIQIRAMLERKPPIYIFCPGRVYRTDELDATHTPVFHQFEGLAIDSSLNMSHLVGTLEFFASQMFGEKAKIRLRPSYFPFTEPSAELDVFFEQEEGNARWIEWGGCGMVNPNVLKTAGIDSKKYSGFAFGMGAERTLQFRNRISNMRDIVDGDIRFSSQFCMDI